jgi:hypothetical protein
MKERGITMSKAPKKTDMSEELYEAVETELEKVAPRSASDLAESKRQIAEARPAHSETNSAPSVAEAGVPVRYSTVEALENGLGRRLSVHDAVTRQANAQNAALASQLAQTFAARIPQPKSGG